MIMIPVPGYNIAIAIQREYLIRSLNSAFSFLVIGHAYSDRSIELDYTYNVSVCVTGT